MDPARRALEEAEDDDGDAERALEDVAPVTKEDIWKAVASAKPSIGREELERFEKFTKDFVAL